MLTCNDGEGSASRLSAVSSYDVVGVVRSTGAWRGVDAAAQIPTGAIAVNRSPIARRSLGRDASAAVQPGFTAIDRIPRPFSGGPS